jgi:putative salt-induced outer membrane protein YdiY
MMRKPMSRYLFLALLSSLLLAAPLAADTPAADCPPCPDAAVEPPPPPPPLWSGGLGLSLVTTSGNSDVRSFGFDLSLKRLPDPWGLEAGLIATRVDEDGERRAERLFARARAARALTERWEVFGGLAAERDKFAGLDHRSLVETGALWHLLAGDRQTLDLDFGLTWTDESFVAGGSESGFGGLAGLAWSYRFGETATLRERALWYPNFESGGDWRLTSETALEAGLTARWALKLGLLVRYDHHPVPGFETTDTTTTASLVWKL